MVACSLKYIRLNIMYMKYKFLWKKTIISPFHWNTLCVHEFIIQLEICDIQYMNPFFFRVWEFVDTYFRFMLLSRRKTNLLILTSITYVLLITQIRLSIISALKNYRFPSRYEQLWVDQIFNFNRVESFIIIACWNPFPINLVWIYLCWFLFMFCNNKRQCLYTNVFISVSSWIHSYVRYINI